MPDDSTPRSLGYIYDHALRSCNLSPRGLTLRVSQGRVADDRVVG
jgi:hypothetical protein